MNFIGKVHGLTRKIKRIQLMLHFIRTCVLVAVVLGVPGCADEPLFGTPDIRLLKIAVNEQDAVFGFGSLEVEVHFHDAGSHELLGCVRVNSPGARVEVTPNDAVRSIKGGSLTLDDVADRQVYVKVWEDDLSACPAPAAPNIDDHLGTSPHFSGQALADGLNMAFGKVLVIELGI